MLVAANIIDVTRFLTDANFGDILRAQELDAVQRHLQAEPSVFKNKSLSPLYVYFCDM